MINKKKWFSPLFVVFLAVAGIFSVSSYVSNKQVEEAPVVEKAEAKSYSTSNYIYIDTAGYWPKVNKIQLLCRNQNNEEQYQQYGAAVTSPLYGNIWCLNFPNYGDCGYLCIVGYENNSWQKSFWFDEGKWASWTQWHSMPNSGQIVTLSGASSASSVKNAYNIKFYQNDGSGYVVERIKKADESFTIPQPADIGMGASGGRYYIKWSTDEHGKTGTDYIPGGTPYTSNANLTVYMIQSWYNYQYSPNGGSSWIEMKATGGSDSYAEIFKPDDNQELETGQQLTFRRYKTSTSDAESVSSIRNWQGDNYSSGIIYTCTGKVELKVTRDGYTDIYVPGYSQRSIWVTHSGTTTKYHISRLDDLDYYTSLKVTIYPGDTIYPAWNGSADSCEYVTADSHGKFHLANNKAVADIHGVYTIHVQAGEFNNWHDLKFVMEAQESANLYASVFNSTIGAICTGTSSGSRPLSDLRTAWGTSNANGMWFHYYYLTATTKAYFTSATGNPDGNDIQKAVAKYEYAINKYGTSQLSNFMGRTGPYKEAMRDFSPFNLIADDENRLTTIIIIASSSVALLSVTALSVLVIKKRKTKEE